jgi:hypothetical protein
VLKILSSPPSLLIIRFKQMLPNAKPDELARVLLNPFILITDEPLIHVDL